MDRNHDTPAAARAEARVLLPLLALFWIGSIAATMAQVYLQQSIAGSRPSLYDLLPWVLPGYVVLTLHDGTRLRLSRTYCERVQAALGQSL